MQNIIKNLEKLSFLSEKDIERIEEEAKLHLRFANISFEVIHSDSVYIEVLVVQDRHLSENYRSKETLKVLAKNLFQKYMENKIIHIQTIPYETANIH